MPWVYLEFLQDYVMTSRERLQGFGGDQKEDEKGIHYAKWEKVSYAKIRGGV